MKIAYCGYDFFGGVLEELLQNGHEIIELFSWPTDNEYDFNTLVFSVARKVKARITLSPIKVLDLQRLQANGVEIIISAAYPYKIPKWQDFVPYALNVHPSPLPEGKGPWPLPWIILRQFKRSAVTIHEVSSELDSGDILAQEFFDVSDRETLVSLSLRSQIIARSLVSNVVSRIGELWHRKTAQSGPGSFWNMPAMQDRTIVWTMSVEEIDRICRAFRKFEPFLFIDDKRYFVRQVDCWKENHDLTPGAIWHKSNREVVYAASDGFVSLTDIVKAY